VVVAGVAISYLSKISDLGMTLNDRLTFDDHINDLCSKVHYSLRNLWSASEYISSKLKLRLVKALVNPQFLFGYVLFRMADSTGLRKLEVAFNYCVWFVYGLRRNDHVSQYTYLLTYLCGTTTNIWLRPVQEDLSMTACLEHSASNL
jgi:hypothetical protein